MSNAGGPWGREPQDEDSRPRPSSARVPRHRFAIWLALMAALAGGLWVLSRAFPGRVNSAEDKGWVVQTFVLFGVISAGVLNAGRIRWTEKARHAAIWAGVVAVLVLGLTYRDELAGVGRRVMSEFSSSYPVASGAHELVVTQEDGGGFFVMGKVNGQLVRFLVDTGSSDTVLSPADAERIGVGAAGLHFDHMAETANGTGYGAPFIADSLEVGPIRFDALPMVVNQAPMTSSLLGMTFLNRLESFQVRGRKLYLTWRS
jgi:aspartyl protease family protein